ncbi:putative Fe-S cluster assembly factor HCF101, chloroplastic [Cocos nucifera]|nr:putative Fe-S cluster assembly factor HCF101, chloroplastic [Cocos nucifera]
MLSGASVASTDMAKKDVLKALSQIIDPDFGTDIVSSGASVASTDMAKKDVLKALSQIIDPDFGTDIVSCGFVKDLTIDETLKEVSFRLELTTPACPIKDMGGVGKSTIAVNLAYTLAGMGARVGIFDADVYGPSLPTMVSPENRLLEMNPETRTILPTEYLGVKLVSFGFTGQGRAIMRGPMVSGVINQLLTTAEWIFYLYSFWPNLFLMIHLVFARGELDYLIIDMPPGTGDIQLTLCQVAPLTAAVIVTTPQKLAFIDVAKGVRMFSKLKVPCVAVVENMCYFDADGKRYYPFGKGSGCPAIWNTTSL